MLAALKSMTPKDLVLVLTEEWDDSTRCWFELQDEEYSVALRVTSPTLDVGAVSVRDTNRRRHSCHVRMPLLSPRPW